MRFTASLSMQYLSVVSASGAFVASGAGVAVSAGTLSGPLVGSA